jgi:enamine deaminase RidA (YjgF/YER057c/UK114 family)
MVISLVLIAQTINAGRGDRDDINERLEAELLQLGFPNGTLPVLVPALGNYVDVVEVDTLLFLSSAAPQTPAGTFVKGRIPNEVPVAQAITAAKLACVRQVNRLKTYLGNLNRVRKIVMIKGKLLAQSDFTGHTSVVDGCSTFLVNVFGEDIGKHARTVDGLASTPFNVTLEVEMIVQRR